MNNNEDEKDQAYYQTYPQWALNIVKRPDWKTSSSGTFYQVDHDYQEESPLDRELTSLLKEFDNPIANTALKRIRKQNLEIVRLKKEISNLTKRTHIK